MMKPTTVDGKPKIANGINFSSLARNAGKFYGTKIIGIENPSPEVSPIKSKFGFWAILDSSLNGNL